MVVSLRTRIHWRATRPLSLAVALIFGVSSAAAETRRLVVLQHGGAEVDESLRREVDRLVLRAATTEVGYQDAYASPVPLEDVELAAGCSAREAGCLARIAKTLGADSLMLRDLSRDPDGKVQLALTIHDGRKDAPSRRAEGVMAADPGSPEQVVPGLLEQLFPGVRLRREERAPRRLDLRAPSGIVGISSLGVATTLLAAGLATGVASRRAQRDYDETMIESQEDVTRAREHLDRAHRRADIANGLFYASGASAAVAVSSLLYNYLRGRSAEAPSVGVTTASGSSGVTLTLQGAWRGGI